MKRKIEHIVIGERFRKDLGDLKSLASSIEKRGLIHPVVVNEYLELIAGARRLAACKLLGWSEIEVTFAVINGAEIIYAERDENTERKAFTPSEMYEVSRRILEIEEKAAKKRMESGTGGGPKGKKTDEPLEKISRGTKKPVRARDSAAEAVGVSRGTLSKIEAVMEAAEGDPKAHSDLVDQMDETGNVSAAFRELKARNRTQAIKEQARSAGSVNGHKLYYAKDMAMIADGSVDLICTDPPYNISRKRNIEHPDRATLVNDFGDWDWSSDLRFMEQMHQWSADFYRVLREGGSVYVFAGEPYTAFFRAALIGVGFTFKNILVWHRTNPKPKPDKTSYVAACDFILFAVKGKGHTFNYTRHSEMFSLIKTPICMGKEREKWGHPTQKPVKLITRLIETSSKPGDLVLDPFAGSGTTGEACQETDRRFILVERERKYISMIEARTGVKHEHAQQVPKVR